MCDFSSAISNIKQAIDLAKKNEQSKNKVMEYEEIQQQLFVAKGMSLIEEGYDESAKVFLNQSTCETASGKLK